VSETQGGFPIRCTEGCERASAQSCPRTLGKRPTPTPTQADTGIQCRTRSTRRLGSLLGNAGTQSRLSTGTSSPLIGEEIGMPGDTPPLSKPVASSLISCFSAMRQAPLGFSVRRCPGCLIKFISARGQLRPRAWAGCQRSCAALPPRAA
jgi:hypothetical protein